MSLQLTSITPRPSFLHIRCRVDAKGVPLPNSGFTVGFVQRDNKLHIACSRCHPKDNYNKRVGRNIVLGRLSTGNYYVTPVNPDQSPRGTVWAFVMNKISQSNWLHLED